MKMKGLVILLVASVALCDAGQKKRHNRRGLHFDEISPGYQMNPPKHEEPSHGWSPQAHGWTKDTSDWIPEEVESNGKNEDEHNSYGEPQQPIEPEMYDEESFHNSGQPQVWSNFSPSESWPNHEPEHKPWKPDTHSHSSPKDVKTIVKEIPVPYERPIRIENPVYTPVEKHIPIEKPVPVVKYVEKPVPQYVDNPVPVPVVKEEHVPQPYDQQVKLILQKVFVHLPRPPPPPPQQSRHTIIIRKKLRHQPIYKKKHRIYPGFIL